MQNRFIPFDIGAKDKKAYNNPKENDRTTRISGEGRGEKGGRMDRIVLKNMATKLKTEDLAKRMHIHKDSDFYDELEEAVEIAGRIARPGAILKWVDVNEVGEDYAVVDGVKFESKVMANNLRGLKKVFFFVATAGGEVQDSREIDDETGVLKDMITSSILMHTYGALMSYVTETFGGHNVAFMNPGSLPDWDISNNFALLEAIGGVGEELGITLSPAGYMKPFQSGSGIIFTNESGYTNCSLCKNLDCVGRRAAFDEEEYNKIFN